MPYDPNVAPVKNLNSLEWSQWVFRTVAGNTGDSSLTDTQLNMYLELSSTTIDGQRYYRPFETAARWLEGSGSNFKTINVGMTSITKFDSERVDSLRQQQADLDRELPVVSDTSDSTQSFVRVSWFRP